MSLDTALAREMPESYRPPWTRCDTCGRHVDVIRGGPPRLCLDCAFAANLLEHGPSECRKPADCDCRGCIEAWQIDEATWNAAHDYYVDEP